MSLILATSLRAAGTVSSRQAWGEYRAGLKLQANKRPAIEGSAFAQTQLEKKDAAQARHLRQLGHGCNATFS